MLVDLFAHVDEVLSGHRVVDHSDTTCLLIALSGEESRLFTEVIDLLGRVRQHVAESTLSIVHTVHCCSQLVLRTTPLIDILPTEESLLSLIEIKALGIVASEGLITEPLALFVGFRLLAQIFEPSG